MHDLNIIETILNGNGTFEQKLKSKIIILLIVRTW